VVCPLLALLTVVCPPSPLQVNHAFSTEPAVGIAAAAQGAAVAASHRKKRLLALGGGGGSGKDGGGGGGGGGGPGGDDAPVLGFEELEVFDLWQRHLS